MSIETGDARPAVPGQGRDHRADPLQLGGGADGLGPRPGGLPTDVEDVGALRRQLPPVGDRPLGVRNSPPSENESGVTLTTPMSFIV